MNSIDWNVVLIVGLVSYVVFELLDALVGYLKTKGPKR